jgi:hypothetical protein
LGKYALVAFYYGRDFRRGLRRFYYSGARRDFPEPEEVKAIKKAVPLTALKYKFICGY